MKALQAQVDEFTYALAQEKAMRFTGATKLQAQEDKLQAHEKNQKAVVAELVAEKEKAQAECVDAQGKSTHFWVITATLPYPTLPYPTL